MGNSPDVDEHVDDYVAAGVYDPSSPTAAGRLELLEWLRAQGITVDQMAANRTELVALAGDMAQAGEQVLSMRDIADRLGMPVERVAEVHRAAGLAPVALDAKSFIADDLEVFAMVHAAGELFSWPELMQFVRVLGSSLSRVGNAANSLFVQDVERPRRSAGATELELAKLNLHAASLARSVPGLLAMFLRLHLLQATREVRRAQLHHDDGSVALELAVGFVDLVGYTARAGALTAAELGELVSRFEATASDVVTEHGGRLVKLIGDEVMFVAVEPATGCAIAADLLRTFGKDPALTPRGGLAYGEVLPRSGDYFGATVNLAARLAEQAVPGEVLATPRVAIAQEGVVVEPAGRRLLKGFADPITLVSITVP